MTLAVFPRIVRSPNVLPSFVRQCSVRFDATDLSGDQAAFDDIAIPDDLRAAVPKRQLHFRAGRFCAMEALRALAPLRRFDGVPRGRGGAPEWPAGVTGSITHTEAFASAAVALTGETRGIGIDSERIMADERARRVADVVASPSELAQTGTMGWTLAETLTIVFSAKETIFKCLHPQVGRMFDYHDVRIEAVDAVAGTFSAQLMASLSPRFHAGTALEGGFELDRPWMHTGMVSLAGQRRVHALLA